MDASSEPDIIRIRPPVIDERPDGIYLYFHPLPSDGGTPTKVDTSGWACDPGDWPIND